MRVKDIANYDEYEEMVWASITITLASWFGARNRVQTREESRRKL